MINEKAVNIEAHLAISLALAILPGSVGAQAQEFHMEFVPITPGEFQMGCAPDDLPNLPDGTYSPCPNAAKPAHRVRITKPFEIGKYEVTQAQWQSVMGANPSYFQGQSLPVEQITWDEIHEFLARLNARNDGYRYRLPTEAEWEYCARAGSARQFGASPVRDAAWFGADGGKLPVTETPGGTHPVGTKLPNAWGVYDMLGNVAEWVEDWYSDTYYKSSPGADPTGPPTGQLHVARGGSWFSNRLEQVYNGAGSQAARRRIPLRPRIGPIVDSVCAWRNPFVAPVVLPPVGFLNKFRQTSGVTNKHREQEGVG